MKNPINIDWTEEPADSGIWKSAIELTEEGIYSFTVQITDAAGNEMYTRYTNHLVHYEYVGRITHPTVESYFNTIATYDHITVVPVVDLTIEISTSGASIGIGFGSARITKDRRTVELEESIHYVP